MTAFRYKAFVSYSWADAAWGKWLHQAIETYRTPAALIGKDGANGAVPARLHPLFKDREEEAAGSSIGNAVETALDASEFLIVVCSPRSAQSQWVNREIAWFKTHRDPDNILALIVDGEPGGGDAECFPRALTHRVAADMSITDIPVDAPLAADARDSGDGKRRAKLKLVAAMLGVGLDELVNRDERRRTIRTRLVVGASLALALVMSGMAWFAVQARNEADLQRAEADGLVEFMLTDLREKLEPVGRLDALDVVGQRALKYYAGQKPGDLDADALGRRSRALHLVGEIRNIRGDSVAGLAAFRQAAVTTGELLGRDPGNAQRIFDHAQSVFWVGYIAYERGETKEAEAQFRDYKRLADRLVALNPKKPEWQLEVGYAESNLGILFYEKGRYADAESAFSNGLRMVQSAAAAGSPDTARQLEIGSAINWLGKARAGIYRISDALELFQQEIATYAGILKSDPGNTSAKLRMAVAWQHVGQLEQVLGFGNKAVAAYGSSLAIMAQLRTIEPANTEWQETTVRGLDTQIDNLAYEHRLSEARTLYLHAVTLLEKMVSQDPKNTNWSIGRHSSIEVRGARLALFTGDTSQALQLAQAAFGRIADSKKFDGPEAVRTFVEAGILAGDSCAKLGRKAEAQAYWQAALAKLDANPIDFQSVNLRSRYLLLRRLGKPEEASKVAQSLDRQGYRHPAYLHER